MGLRDAIEATPTAGYGARCHVSLLLSRLDDDDRDDFLDILNDPTFTSTRIAKGLATIGHKIGVDSLQRHRRGACGCHP